MFWGFTASSLIQNDSVLGYIWIVVTELNKWYSYSPDIFKPNIIHISIWMNFQTRIYLFLYLHNLSNQNNIHIRLKFENWIAQISPKIKFCFVIKFSLYLESGSNDNCWCPQISKFFTKVKNQRFALFTWSSFSFLFETAFEMRIVQCPLWMCSGHESAKMFGFHPKH